MYACKFKGCDGIEFDTITSICYADATTEDDEISGIMFYSAEPNGFDWLIPMNYATAEEVMNSIGNCYPGLIDMTAFNAIHVDNDAEPNISGEELDLYKGKPIRKGFFEKAMNQLNLTE